MRILFASALVASSLAMAPLAFAASETVTGTVKAINASQHELTLANGDTFMLPKNFNAKDIKSGAKVKVAYQKAGKKLEAEMVTVVN
jgi:predicted RecA/RadA family phage recombinase